MSVDIVWYKESYDAVHHATDEDWEWVWMNDHENADCYWVHVGENGMPQHMTDSLIEQGRSIGDCVLVRLDV